MTNEELEAKLDELKEKYGELPLEEIAQVHEEVSKRCFDKIDGLDIPEDDKMELASDVLDVIATTVFLGVEAIMSEVDKVAGE